MAVLGSLFAVSGSYDRLTNMGSFGNLIFYALNSFGLLYARKRLPTPVGHRMLPLWIPIIFLLATTAILLSVAVTGPREIIVAMIVLALGIPIYMGLRWRYRSTTLSLKR